jgi:hypothetical protein
MLSYSRYAIIVSVFVALAAGCGQQSSQSTGGDGAPEVQKEAAALQSSEAAPEPPKAPQAQTPAAPDPEPESEPEPQAIVPVEPSAKMAAWLSNPVSIWDYDFTIQELAEDLRGSMFFGDEGLQMKIAPGVEGRVKGQWVSIPHGQILDEVCQKNNLRWDVVEPNTILISEAQ